VKSNLQDKFIPMAVSEEEGQKFVLNKNDGDFEACRKIICKEGDWKMYTVDGIAILVLDFKGICPEVYLFIVPFYH